MSILSRRFFLSGVASIPATLAAAAPVGAITLHDPTVADGAPRAAAENPDLVALGERIQPLLDTYRSASDRRRIARAHADADLPILPDELVAKERLWRDYCVDEVDVEGNPIYQKFVDDDGKVYDRVPRRIIRSHLIKASIERGDACCDRRTKFGKQLHRTLETAERYDAERAAAIERSGIEDASDDLREAAYNIELLAYRVRDIEPLTIAGVIIQARALAAHAEAEIDAGGSNGRSGTVLGGELARAILRLADQRSSGA